MRLSTMDGDDSLSVWTVVIWVPIIVMVVGLIWSMAKMFGADLYMRVFRRKDD